MDEILFQVRRLDALLKETWQNARSPQNYGAFAAAKVIVIEVDKFVDEFGEGSGLDVGNLSTILTSLSWHIGALFGFEIDNGHDHEQHYVWCLGELSKLQNILGNASA